MTTEQSTNIIAVDFQLDPTVVYFYKMLGDEGDQRYFPFHAKNGRLLSASRPKGWSKSTWNSNVSMRFSCIDDFEFSKVVNVSPEFVDQYSYKKVVTASVLSARMEEAELIHIERMTAAQQIDLLPELVARVAGEYKIPTQHIAIVAGSAGVGKTTTVENCLHSLGIPKMEVNPEDFGDDAAIHYGSCFVLISGDVSPTGLFCTMRAFPNAVLVLDDVTSATKSGPVQDMLTAATQTVSGPRGISNIKKGGTRIEFNGSVIFLTNKRVAEFHRALSSRAGMNVMEVFLSPSEMLDFILERVPMYADPRIDPRAMEVAHDMIIKYQLHPDIRPFDLRSALSLISSIDHTIKMCNRKGFTDDQIAASVKQTALLALNSRIIAAK